MSTKRCSVCVRKTGFHSKEVTNYILICLGSRFYPIKPRPVEKRGDLYGWLYTNILYFVVHAFGKS